MARYVGRYQRPKRQLMGGATIPAVFGVRRPRTLFSAPLNVSGVSNLSQSITLNGEAKSPTLWYEAKDISGTTWTAVAGDDLGLSAGAGGNPTTGEPTPFTDDTEAVRFDPSGKNYVASDTLTGNVGTDDFVFEALVYTRPSSSGTQYIAMKQNTSGQAGWSLFCFTGGDYRFQLHDGTTSTVVVSSSMSAAWNHFLVVADRSGSMRLYVNCASVDTTSISTVGNADNAVAFSIGGRQSGAATCQSDVAFVALWKGANWLDTHEQDDFAAARFAQLVGTSPTTYEGTPTPVFTRATDAYLDLRSAGGVTTFQRVGAGWPRIARRADTTPTNQTGYLAERQATNEFSYSHDFANWPTINNGTVTSDAVASPEPGVSADAFIASTATFGHYVQDTPTVVNTTIYMMSVYLKDGASFGWVNFDVGNNVDGCYFDVANVTTGSSYGSNVGAYGIESIGDGWYRCYMVWTAPYSGAPTVRIRAAQANNDHSFAGDGSTVNFYAYGAQWEAIASSTEPPSTLIPTNGAPATRNGDQLYYVADDGNYNDAEGYVQIAEMLPNIDLSGGSLRHFVTAYVDASRYMTLYGQASLDRLRLGSDATTGFDAQGASGDDVADGDMHTVRFTYETDNAALYFDGSLSGSPDTSGEPPTGVARIGVGMDETAVGQPNGLLANLELYNVVPEDV